MLRQKVEQYVQAAVATTDQIEITIPEHAQFGHFSTSVAMKLAKERKQSPMTVAQEIAGRLPVIAPEGFFAKVEAAAPGFVNMTIAPNAIQDGLAEIIDQGVAWGKNIERPEEIKTVVIDYSGPNIAKPMSVGHLRSTVIGQALYNIFKFAGYRTIGDNHLGDWGKQFGVLIAAYKEDGMPQDVTIDYLV